MAFESPKFIQMFPALRFSIALLLVLQVRMNSHNISKYCHDIL